MKKHSISPKNQQFLDNGQTKSHRKRDKTETKENGRLRYKAIFITEKAYHGASKFPMAVHPFWV